MSIVTRFAPSPTGYVHIGSLRTVLYNYLYAKQQDGKFLLRIEDTDRTRYVEGSVENLQQVLETVWLHPDEGPNNPGEYGPYFQSERLDIYKKYTQELLDSGNAYHCFCTPERLTELRSEQESLGLPTKYDRKCLYLTEEEKQAKLDAGEPHVIRLKVPDNTEISFEDTIRGRITVPSKDVDDQVLIKTDGYPTYHMAVVVDDYLMQVTDIIRGDEWIPSTPKHIILYDAFSWEKPRFSHVPPLLWSDGKKLSKRTGDVAVEAFLEKWYLPEAILNYIALLWWNPKTTEEYFTLDELIERFKLEDVHRSGAKFEEERLEGFNAHYIKQMDIDTLWEQLKAYLETYNPKYLQKISNSPISFTKKILTELQTRMKRFGEFEEISSFFYEDVSAPIDTDLLINPKMKIETLYDAKVSLEFALEIIQDSSFDDSSSDTIKDMFIPAIADSDMKNGQVLWPVRVALSGEQFSPGAFELISVFWREKSIGKIEKVLNQIS